MAGQPEQSAAIGRHGLQTPGISSSSPQGPGEAIRRSGPPQISDHELLKCVGRGSYGEVWLARNILGVHRAVKVVYRTAFDHDRPFERAFEGIQKFEPISRTHESQVAILHVGRNEEAGYFYYVMDLADDAGQKAEVEGQR